MSETEAAVVVFKLDDINETPLRNAAVELGIPNAATAPKADLVREIRNRIGGGGAFLLAPAGVGNPPPKKDIVGLISVVAAALAPWRR